MKKTMILSALVMVLGLIVSAPAAQACPGHEGKQCPFAHKKHKGYEYMMKKHDLDGDGAITKEEALKAAETRFTKMDADKDGKVTKEEGEAYYKAKHAAMKAKMEAKAKDADAGKADGKAEEKQKKAE